MPRQMGSSPDPTFVDLDSEAIAMRKPSSPTTIIVLMSGLLLGGLLSPAASAEDPAPCSAKSFKIAKVKAACEDGGQPAAKNLMKAAVKKAKEAGESMTCKSCHSELKTYALTGDDPVGKLEKWL